MMYQPSSRSEVRELKKAAKFAAKHGKLAINHQGNIVRGYEDEGVFFYVYESEVESGKFTVLGQLSPERVHYLE